MKKSIEFLPKRKQDDLNYIVSLIRKKLPQAEMIILYGSYARNQYVERDERIEFGICTTYMSDYDILVVTQGISDKDAGKILDNIDDNYYQFPKQQTPVQFINESIEKLNKELSEGRYFYTEVKEQGIMLYDSEKYTLAPQKELDFDEIAQQAEEYYWQKSRKANSFLQDVQNAYNRGDYVQASFYLHQTCENYYYAIQLVCKLKNNKQHNLAKLCASVKTYSNDLHKVFPRNSEEEERLFNLIKAAYVDARYNPDFKVTKEDIEALTQKVELLGDITQRMCQDRINEYRLKSKKSSYIRSLDDQNDLGRVAEE